MWPNHPTAGTNYPPLPLIEGESTIQVMPDQTQLTTWYTQRAVSFIERNRSRPFFLYVPHSMPHVPLFVSDKFKGRSKRGLYADVIEELDWSVGEILAALKRNGLDERTLVIFTSDNGPWLLYGNHVGSAGLLREGKATVFEGGVRMPMIARWPGKIPPGRTCGAVSITMDLLPTIVHLAGGEVPPDRIVDGKDIWPLLSGKRGASPPPDIFFIIGETSCTRCAMEDGSCISHIAIPNRSRLEAMADRGPALPIKLVWRSSISSVTSAKRAISPLDTRTSCNVCKGSPRKRAKTSVTT